MQEKLLKLILGYFSIIPYNIYSLIAPFKASFELANMYTRPEHKNSKNHLQGTLIPLIPDGSRWNRFQIEENCYPTKEIYLYR